MTCMAFVFLDAHWNCSDLPNSSLRIWQELRQNAFLSIKIKHISLNVVWRLKKIVFMEFFPSFMNHNLAPKVHYSFHSFVLFWLDMSSADTTFLIFIHLVSVIYIVCVNHKSLLCTFTKFFRQCCSAHSYLIIAQSFTRIIIF